MDDGYSHAVRPLRVCPRAAVGCRGARAASTMHRTAERGRAAPATARERRGSRRALPWMGAR
ncbi:hypothetical protein ACFFRL_07930 [Agromyces hippuratus]|uniref:hypothetical protein n=1 Tax=Agromyces hippuratus TaxID=286438 RepID=UPI0035E68F24